MRCCSTAKRKNTHCPGAKSVAGPLPLTLTAVILYISRWVGGGGVFQTRKVIGKEIKERMKIYTVTRKTRAKKWNHSCPVPAPTPDPPTRRWRASQEQEKMGIIILTLERGIKADTPDRSIHVVRHHSCWKHNSSKKSIAFPFFCV